MTLSRREILQAAMLVSALTGAWPAVTAAAWTPASHRSLALRPRAVLIDGRPVYLTMGSMDYFRCPSGEWRDRLLQAKRSGLNTIMTCIAWNFHERAEGVLTFTGDADLGRFLDICAELELYVFLRAGPFICDEWEAAGHPAWLYGKRDIELRAYHEPTLVFVRRWFEQLMPIVAKRQVTRGGSVILIQQENEYLWVGDLRLQEYQLALIEMMRQLGIEVPITDCSGDRPQTRVASSLMTQNGGAADSVAGIRKLQTDKPAIISELYTDYAIPWGWPVSSYPTSRMVYQQTLETVAAGGMYSYFMFYGGTNFGFWASTTWKSDEAFVTTCYYPRSPLAEGGAFNESFWAAKAANLLVRGAEAILTNAEAATLPASFSGPVRAQAVRAAQGYLIFVQPAHPDNISSVYHTDNQSGPLIQTAEDWPFMEIASEAGSMRLQSGAEFELAESSSYPAMLPFELEIDPACRINYANASFLGVAGNARRRVVLLRGEAGRQGIVCVNGKRVEFVFSADTPARCEVGGVTVLGLSHELADRTWFADGGVLIGAAYVGSAKAGLHECFADGKSAQLHTISPQGTIATRALPLAPVVTAHIPLRLWSAHPLPEIVTESGASSPGWRALERPVNVEELGAYWGYSWYRAVVESPASRTSGLLFTDASDRLTVFANGKRAGI